jgi:hypothetical protein
MTMHAPIGPVARAALSLLALTGLLLALAIAASATARSDALDDMLDRFDTLSTQGNSNCSGAFRDAIPNMSTLSMLQGSCCAPMDQHHYEEQVQALVKYRDIPEIPVNPYDVPAGQAARLMHYDAALVLGPDEEAMLQYAMENSDEKGPCCCMCWRWNVYNGLAKFLIREHGFTGPEVVEVWNLSNGCGGGAEHMHG